MPAKWQKESIDIPAEYDPIERESIAQDIIDFIAYRTRVKKLDKNNEKFTPGYSKGYAKSRVGQVAGKVKGGTPNLKLSGEMLQDLGEYTKTAKGKITIGYNKDSESNNKADGNIRGTYGKPAPINGGKYARDFLGIAKADLDRILAKYPTEETTKAQEKKAKNIATNIDAIGQARALKYVTKAAKKEPENTVIAKLLKEIRDYGGSS